MINLVLCEIAVICLWLMIALIGNELLGGLTGVLISSPGLMASFFLVQRIFSKNDVTHKILSKIENEKETSINKKEALEQLNNKEVKRFPGMQIGEVKK